MTNDEMKTYAQDLLDGKPVKKAEVLTFMKAYLDAEQASDPHDPDLQAGGPAMTKEEVLAKLPPLYFEIEKTGSGIHVPRDANRSYTKAEGAALLAKLAEALK